MKKFFVSLMALVVVASSAIAQQNVVKINPLSFAVATFSGFYERALNEKMSVVGGLGYSGYSISTGIGDFKSKTSYTGIFVTGEYRYYVTNASKDAPRGFYVGPYARFANYTVKSSSSVPDFGGGTTTVESSVAMNVMTFGGILGNQWLFGDKVALDLFVGPNYNMALASASAGSFESGGLSLSGVGFRFGMALGFAF